MANPFHTSLACPLPHPPMSFPPMCAHPSWGCSWNYKCQPQHDQSTIMHPLFACGATRCHALWREQTPLHQVPSPSKHSCLSHGPWPKSLKSTLNPSSHKCSTLNPNPNINENPKHDKYFEHKIMITKWVLPTHNTWWAHGGL